MLGINYRKIESNSVGYKSDYEMRSMDFEEFLWAKGYDDEFISGILNHMKSLTPFSNLEFSVLNSMFLDFCILGGMPAVVRDYIEGISKVKATNGRSKSLRALIDNDRYQDIKYGIKLANANIGFNDDIYTFPYFCAFLLKRYLKEKDI